MIDFSTLALFSGACLALTVTHGAVSGYAARCSRRWSAGH